jgi:hypothetical protein
VTWIWANAGPVVFMQVDGTEGQLRDGGMSQTFIGVGNGFLHFLAITEREGVLYYGAPAGEWKVEPRYVKKLFSRQIGDFKMSHLPWFVILIQDLYEFFDDRDASPVEPTYIGRPISADEFQTRCSALIHSPG